MKKFLIIGIIILLIISIFIIITFILLMNYMKASSESQRYYERGLSIIPTADYIVVPGAKINEKFPDLVLSHRLDYAYKLYQEKKAPKIIISGGFDKEVKKDETEIMYSYLIQLGIPSEDIISDLNGNNTYSTLKRVKDFVGNKSVIFCTQEIYSYRAIYIANHLDLNMNVFCSDPIIYSGRTKAIIREYLAQTKAVLNCTLFKPNVISLIDAPFYSYHYGRGNLIEKEIYNNN